MGIQEQLRHRDLPRIGSTSAPALEPVRNGSPSVRAHIAALAEGQIQVRLLQGFSRHERHAILAAASYRDYSNTSTVVHQGNIADKLFLLIKGSARFFFITPGGRKVYLHWLSPGEIFGGASLLTEPSNFLVSTEVAKGTHALVWNRNVVRSLIAVYPRLLENALSVASDYLVWYLASHLGLICHTAPQRLAHVLVSLAGGIGQKTPHGTELAITNEQLANTANITLFTASRVLNEFQRRGALHKKRGKIILLRPDRLFG